MRNSIYPKLNPKLLPQLGAISLAGSLVAGVYGVVHDQITFSVSSEYFTKLKFAQFAAVDFGLPHRWLAAEIGFLATWWFGLIAGWFLARLAVPMQPGVAAWLRCARGFAITLCGALIGAILGYGLSLHPSALEAWRPALQSLEIRDGHAFTGVVFIHWGGYLGAAVGLIVALARLRFQQRKLAQ